MAAVDVKADVPMSPQDMWEHAPNRVALSGSGKGGAKYTVTLTVSPAKKGSNLGVRLELGGRALFGPVGAAAARAVKGDVEKSLKQFVQLYG